MVSLVSLVLVSDGGSSALRRVLPFVLSCPRRGGRCDFSLAGKVTKRALRGKPLKNPCFLRGSPVVLARFLAARGLRDANRMPRSPAPAEEIWQFMPFMRSALFFPVCGAEHLHPASSADAANKDRCPMVCVPVVVFFFVAAGGGGCSVLRDGLLLYRNKSNQKSSKGHAPWQPRFSTGVPDIPRTFHCGTRLLK